MNGITTTQALVLAAAEREGARRLDPERFDDAAVLLRAETLADDGMSPKRALASAREEFVTDTQAATC